MAIQRVPSEMCSCCPTVNNVYTPLVTTAYPYLYLLSLPDAARVPDRDPGEEVDLPELYILEDTGNSDLRPGVTFSCQVQHTWL